MGQVDNKFIATVMKGSDESSDFLVLFDQHAVHERIRLEENMAGMKHTIPTFLHYSQVLEDVKIILEFGDTKLYSFLLSVVFFLSSILPIIPFYITNFFLSHVVFPLILY